MSRTPERSGGIRNLVRNAALLALLTIAGVVLIALGVAEMQAARTPLMLQTVLGLDAARIAGAFLVAPAAMSQRLVRAKTKIRDAGVPFDIPSARELPERVEAVMEAIYAAYGTAWDDALASTRNGAD
jgi:predicted RNA polymerase sigma factor